MKQIVVGTYYAGFNQIELVLRDGVGSEYYNCPEKGKCPRIKIGADYNNWGGLVNSLLHELYEFLYDKLQCRYVAYEGMTNICLILIMLNLLIAT